MTKLNKEFVVLWALCFGCSHGRDMTTDLKDTNVFKAKGAEVLRLKSGKYFIYPASNRVIPLQIALERGVAIESISVLEDYVKKIQKSSPVSAGRLDSIADSKDQFDLLSERDRDILGLN